jgi:peptide/nickel transport system permease protein
MDWFVRRLLSLGAVLLIVTFGTFALMALLPGDPAVAILGPGAATPENIAIVRSDLGLDKPLPVRYVQWMGRAAQGDLGVSYRTGEVVAKAVRQRIAVSLELAVLAQTLALLIAVPSGVWAGYRANRPFDRTASAGAFGLVAMPQFVMGIILIAVFGVWLKWFPIADYVPLSESVIGNLKSMVLPAFTLALPLAGLYTRVLRADVALTAQSEHVMLARASGLPTRRIIGHHILRGSSLGLLTVIGLNVSFLLGGAVIVERLFSLPGIGRLLLESVVTHDFVMVQGCVLIVALTYVVVNIIIDVLLRVLDPRLRHPVDVR